MKCTSDCSNKCFSPSYTYLIKVALPIFNRQTVQVPLLPGSLDPLPQFQFHGYDVIYYFPFSLVPNAAFSLVIITCSRTKTDPTIFSALVDPVPVPQIIGLMKRRVEGRQTDKPSGVSVNSENCTLISWKPDLWSGVESLGSCSTWGLLTSVLTPNIWGKSKTFFFSLLSNIFCVRSLAICLLLIDCNGKYGVIQVVDRYIPRIRKTIAPSSLTLNSLLAPL